MKKFKELKESIFSLPFSVREHVLDFHTWFTKTQDFYFTKSEYSDSSWEVNTYSEGGIFARKTTYDALKFFKLFYGFFKDDKNRLIRCFWKRFMKFSFPEEENYNENEIRPNIKIVDIIPKGVSFPLIIKYQDELKEDNYDFDGVKGLDSIWLSRFHPRHLSTIITNNPQLKKLFFEIHSSSSVKLMINNKNFSIFKNLKVLKLKCEVVFESDPIRDRFFESINENLECFIVDGAVISPEKGDLPNYKLKYLCMKGIIPDLLGMTTLAYLVGLDQLGSVLNSRIQKRMSFRKFKLNYHCLKTVVLEEICLRLVIEFVDNNKVLESLKILVVDSLNVNKTLFSMKNNHLKNLCIVYDNDEMWWLADFVKPFIALKRFSIKVGNKSQTGNGIFSLLMMDTNKFPVIPNKFLKETFLLLCERVEALEIVMPNAILDKNYMKNFKNLKKLYLTVKNITELMNVMLKNNLNQLEFFSTVNYLKPKHAKLFSLTKVRHLEFCEADSESLKILKTKCKCVKSFKKRSLPKMDWKRKKDNLYKKVDFIDASESDYGDGDVYDSDDERLMLGDRGFHTFKKHRLGKNGIFNIILCDEFGLFESSLMYENQFFF